MSGRDLANEEQVGWEECEREYRERWRHKRRSACGGHRKGTRCVNGA
jgi:hypothetical protein